MTVFLLVWEPDIEDNSLGGLTEVQVFADRDNASKFSRANFRFESEDDQADQGKAMTVAGELFEFNDPDNDDESASGTVEIYSAELR